MVAFSMAISWPYLLSAAALCLGSFLVSLLVVGAVLVKLPAAYFLDRPARQLWVDQHPVVRLLLLIAKNLLGLCVVAVGILLLLPGVPGQGLLTVLIGLMLVDFPGKRRLETWLVARPRVLKTVNRLRQRFAKPPLQLPNQAHADAEDSN
jgi:uncharacterized membrane protein YbaN (DUF454 family)